MKLILASSSPYRREMLKRLRIPFSVIPAHVNEAPLPNERPDDLAKRLAYEKAQFVVEKHPNAVVIGADQVAALGEKHLGKPGCHKQAVEQLKQMSGHTVYFHSAISVCQAKTTKQRVVTTRCQFRTLTNKEINQYLEIEKPYDTAGSAKAEGLGIALMESMQSDDPTAIIGLPLIALCDLLRQFNLNPLITN